MTTDDRPKVTTGIHRWIGEQVRRTYEWMGRKAAIGPDDVRGRRFGAFGSGSIICFPANTIYNERYIRIGADTMFGPGITLSAGMVPGQQMLFDRWSRSITMSIGKGSGIVGHLSITIGDDVWTGHHVYITDQNHGYEDVEVPISLQVMPNARCGSAADLAGPRHGGAPGADIGEHVVVGANSVSGILPDRQVAAGVPARVLRWHDAGRGWIDARDEPPPVQVARSSGS
ncbi:MAG: acyltransferase [Ilumatobacteraceae bacterium]